MEIETVDDLADQICDWVGCYGGCKHSETGDGCTDESIFCCRIGAMMVLPDRIINAVRNSDKLDELLGKELFGK